jgi:hypothetical protein
MDLPTKISIASAGVAIIASVGATIYAFGKFTGIVETKTTNTRERFDEILSRLDSIDDRLTDIETRLTKVEIQAAELRVVLTGANGANGINSIVKGIDARLRELEKAA